MLTLASWCRRKIYLSRPTHLEQVTSSWNHFLRGRRRCITERFRRLIVATHATRSSVSNLRNANGCEWLRLLRIMNVTLLTTVVIADNCVPDEDSSYQETSHFPTFTTFGEKITRIIVYTRFAMPTLSNNNIEIRENCKKPKTHDATENRVNERAQTQVNLILLFRTEILTGGNFSSRSNPSRVPRFENSLRSKARRDDDTPIPAGRARNLARRKTAFFSMRIKLTRVCVGVHVYAVEQSYTSAIVEISDYII